MRSVFYPRLVNGPFGDPALYVRVAHRGEALLFDSGDLRPLTTREVLKLRAVLLSHHHIDHVAGFDTLLRPFLYSEANLLIAGPPGTIERIGHRLAATTWNLTAGYRFALTVRDWGPQTARQAIFRADRGFVPEAVTTQPCPDGQVLATAAWRVRAVPLEHGGITSLAYRLEEPLHVAIHPEALAREGLAPGPWLTRFKDLVRGQDREQQLEVPLAEGGTRWLTVGGLAERIAHVAAGMKLVYVTDVDPSPENCERIVALAAGAHLLAIEATFAGAEAGRARQRGHLTAPLAGALGRRAGAGRLLVFHHSPRYRDEPERLRREALAAFHGEAEAAG